MKYLYPYECEKRGLSSPNELQAAIDSNRREGRRQSFGGSLFAYSPGGAHGMLSSPKLPVPSLGLAASTNGSSVPPAPKIKKGKGRPSGPDSVPRWWGPLTAEGTRGRCCPPGHRRMSPSVPRRGPSGGSLRERAQLPHRSPGQTFLADRWPTDRPGHRAPTLLTARRVLS